MAVIVTTSGASVQAWELLLPFLIINYPNTRQID